jgi:type III secretion system FlhB-like substrate exporter
MQVQSKLPIMPISKTSCGVVHAPNETNRLHRMPAEIHNNIFWNLWASYSIIWTKSGGMQFLLCFLAAISKHSVTSRGLPIWLLVCKMFLYEGRAMLSRMASVTVGPWASDPNLTWNYSSLMVIMPSLQKELTIRTGSLSAAYNTIGALFRPNHVGLHTIKQVLNYLKLERTVTGGVLRCLRVQTTFVNVCSECQRQANLLLGIDSKASWQMDLHCLERAALNLDRFELEVRDINTTIGPDRLWHATNHWHEVVPYIEKEVRRVGRALTGKTLGAFSMPLTTPANTVLFRYDRQVTPDTAAFVRSQPRRATKIAANRRITMLLEEERAAAPKVEGEGFPQVKEAMISEVEEAIIPISRKRQEQKSKAAADRKIAIYVKEEATVPIARRRSARRDRASKGTSRPKTSDSRPRAALGDLPNYSERDNRLILG